jgi:hypothetical protein
VVITAVATLTWSGITPKPVAPATTTSRVRPQHAKGAARFRLIAARVELQAGTGRRCRGRTRKSHARRMPPTTARNQRNP